MNVTGGSGSPTLREGTKTMSVMKDSEAWAIRKMANAAKRSNVRLARWLEDAPTSIGRTRVWVCGWYTEDHPDDMHHVGWRWTKEEISELCVSAGVLFSEIVKPKRIKIHGPANVSPAIL